MTENNIMDTQGLIDGRNIELWNTLRRIYEIEIQRENRNDYYAFSKNKKTIIYVPLDNIDPESFTHELLHIYLRTMDVLIGAGLSSSIRESKILSKIFSDNLLNHIGNCLDHIKMFPEYIKLGYSPDRFIQDYLAHKLTTEEIFMIKQHFTINIIFKKIYNSKAIDLYIGKYFAAKACPNKSIDYSKLLNDLKVIDAALFQILEDFLKAWDEFDYTDKDPITGGYQTILFNFINDLVLWTNGKIIK